MFMYFNSDRGIPFDQLTDGRLEAYDITTQVDPDINGRPSASLICDGSKLLVRTDDKGMVYRLIPIEIDIGRIRHMLAAIGDEFNVVCQAEYDGPYRYVREDIEEPD